AALEHCASERDARAAPATRLAGEELVDVLGDVVVEALLRRREVEGLRDRAALGEQALAIEVVQLLLNTARKPRAVLERDHLAVEVEADELILVEEPKEVLVLVDVPLVRSGGQEEQAVGLAREELAELVAASLLHLSAVRPRRALVRL